MSRPSLAQINNLFLETIRETLVNVEPACTVQLEKERGASKFVFVLPAGDGVAIRYTMRIESKALRAMHQKGWAQNLPRVTREILDEMKESIE